MLGDMCQFQLIPRRESERETKIRKKHFAVLFEILGRVFHEKFTIFF